MNPITRKIDDSGRLTRILSEVVSPQSVIMDRNLDYYANGKIAEIMDVETGRISSYGYDGLMRLSSWSDNQQQYFESYSFVDGATPNPKLQSVTGGQSQLALTYGVSGDDVDQGLGDT